ncbi:uncharacterized protein N7515_000714 [Penicillium bovifimosum]|uniref:Cytochrome P450 n=1 Tax=Penicillium bovifimosum TaxID=126998 RepID=A0A9W9HFX1_9EURO|nr:uncharacterized protein N7515_000714 [Penicillium bovifimosum]KAJ5146150.1 hypothetical protein N7515_000714 [Penicillium bovifimosum]
MSKFWQSDVSAITWPSFSLHSIDLSRLKDRIFEVKSSPQLLGTFFLCSIILYFGVVLLRDPLSHVPPLHWSTPFSRLNQLYTTYYHDRHFANYDAHKEVPGKRKFRPVVRVGPNEVSLMTAAGVRTVYGGNFEKAAWYEVFSNYGKNNMFSFTGNADHAARRRIFSSNYLKSNVSTPYIQQIIQSRVEKMIRFIDSAVEEDTKKTQPMVVRNIYRAMQSDISTRFAFSDSYGTDWLDKLSGPVNQSKHTGMHVMDFFHQELREATFFWESEPPFLYVNQLLVPNGPPEQQNAQKWAAGLFRRFEAMLDESSNRDELVRQGVYGKLYTYRDSEGRPLSFEDRASEMLDHIGAGHDTMSASLEYLTRQISLSPDVQAKLREELCVEHGGTFETYADLDKFPYLHAVVMEGLRLVYTINFYQPRVVPKGGCTIEDIYLPEGTIVGSQAYLVHRQPDIFPDPEAFKPERWLVDEQQARVLLRNFWTFGSGQRGCIGRDLAISVLKNTLFAIYTRFQTTLTNEHGPRRPWEGHYAMAEVEFVPISA